MSKAVDKRIMDIINHKVENATIVELAEAKGFLDGLYQGKEQTLKEVEKKFKWQRCDFTDDKNMETMTITRFDWKEFKKEQGLK